MNAEPQAPPRPLPWHEDAWRAFRRQVEQGRLPHALLLTGPAMTGKGQFARLIAQSLLCTRPDADTGTPCGSCSTCHLVRASTHPDLVMLEPEEPGKVIKVDAVREFSAGLRLTSNAGSARVAIVSPACQLHKSAANGLLKTLEEPASGNVILLVTDRPYRLPATIRSRCARMELPLPEREAALTWLSVQAPGSDPGLLLDVSGGRPFAALRLAQDQRMERRALMFQDLIAVVEGREDPVSVAAVWEDRDYDGFLDWLRGCTVDLIRLKSVSNPPDLSNPDFKSRLQPIVDKLELSDLYGRLDAQQEVMLLSNIALNKKLVLQDLLIPWGDGGKNA